MKLVGYYCCKCDIRIKCSANKIIESCPSCGTQIGRILEKDKKK